MTEEDLIRQCSNASKPKSPYCRTRFRECENEERINLYNDINEFCKGKGWLHISQIAEHFDLPKKRCSLLRLFDSSCLAIEGEFVGHPLDDLPEKLPYFEPKKIDQNNPLKRLRSRYMTKEEIQTAYELRKTGMSWRKVAHAVGRNKETVARAVLRMQDQISASIN